MGIRFRKSIKLGDLVKLNISKTGISASVGKSGASLNLGKNGTYVNLNPSIVGVKGTGVSYRKKLTGGYSNLLGSLLGTKEEKAQKSPKNKEIETKTNKELDTSIIDKYNEELETNINLFKYTDNVLDKEKLLKRIDEFNSDSSKEIYKLAQDGDEDTIESLVGAFLNNLELNYKVSANYELEEHTLYVDLDLPEIDNFSNEYPVISKNEIVYKKKTSSVLKEEYAKTILSLSIYLSANFFNISSYINEIVISAFTTLRNSNGDLKDEYLYSIKYLREVFEKTDLTKLDSAYDFILKFENRINMSTTYSFKSIKPYEMASTTKTNNILDDVIEGLKELGYKINDINKIIPNLKELKLESSSDYLKEALKLLANL